MRNAIRRVSTYGAAFSIVFFVSAATAQTAPTRFERQMAKITLGINGYGEFSADSSGTTYVPQTVAQVPSNTAGALGELRYEKSPLIGMQMNYGYARYTQNFTVNDTNGTPSGQLPFILGVQSKVTEFGLGYVAHGPKLFGLQPFGGAGVAALQYKPTAGGGEHLPEQVRAGFYYAIGLEESVFSEHFGLRVQFRQLFFGAPDFNQNYFATGARSMTTEPVAGFFVRF